MALAELLWGGLRPIAGQVVLDILALIGFGALAVAKPQVSKLKSCQPSSAMAVVTSKTKTDSIASASFVLLSFLGLLMATLLALVCGSGGKFTNRWTIVFPMIPFIGLQALRQMILLFVTTTSTTTSTITTATDSVLSIIEKKRTKEDDDRNSNSNSKPSSAFASAFASAQQNPSRIRIKIRAIALVVLGTASGLLLLLAALLTILFPAVELPLPELSHVYDVGIVDLFLPKIKWTNASLAMFPDTAFDPNVYHNDHFAIRILYPAATEEEENDDEKWAALESGGWSVGSLFATKPRSWIPYLRPHLSDAFNEVNMQQGAPPPLKKFGWFTHYWNLIQLPAKYHAPLLQDDKDKDTSKSKSLMLPMVFYSPGLGGSSETYSYQTLSLAARGFVVVVLEHGDGSLAILPRKDGSVFRRSDDSVGQVIIRIGKKRCVL